MSSSAIMISPSGEATDPMPPPPLQQPRRRRRTINSCLGCRRRKSRCDRSQPCVECVKNEESCHYLDEEPGPVRALAGQDLAARVAELEAVLDSHNRLLSRIQSQPYPHLPSVISKADFCDTGTRNDGDQQQPAGSWVRGHLRGKNGRKTEFVSKQHWIGLLQLFPEMNHIRDRPTDDPVLQKLSRLFTCLRDCIIKLKPVPLPSLLPSFSMDVALLALIPSRAVTDILVDAYFRTFEKLHRVLHIPSFSKMYEDFWASPESLDSGWTSTLVVILKLGLLACPVSGQLSDEISPEWVQRMQAQSLQLVELYLHFRSSTGRPSLDYLQTYCLAIIAHITSGTKYSTIWKMTGSLMQLCLLMGLHADPASFPEVVSIFDAEMRRRLWTTSTELCVHVSRSASLPLPIPSNGYQIRPLNLNDGQLSPRITEFPNPLPHTTITDSSFQHILSESLCLRLRLAGTTSDVEAIAVSPADHCIDCGVRKQLQHSDSLLNNPPAADYDLSSPEPFQRVFLDLIAESAYSHYNLLSLSTSTTHSKELLLDSSRAILTLYQDPQLSFAQRFIVSRWFRNAIITATLCLCSCLRKPIRNGLIDGPIPFLRDPYMEQKTMKLIEGTLLQFGLRCNANQNEVEENIILILIVAIVKSNGSNEALPTNFELSLRMFGPTVLSYGDGPLGDKSTQTPEIIAPTSESSAERMNAFFDIDAFMSDFGLNVPF